jgi:hypothetical protein
MKLKTIVALMATGLFVSPMAFAYQEPPEGKVPYIVFKFAADDQQLAPPAMPAPDSTSSMPQSNPDMNNSDSSGSDMSTNPDTTSGDTSTSTDDTTTKDDVDTNSDGDY